MNRNSRTLLARETLEILDAGFYTSPSGRKVNIAELQARAEKETLLYRPADFPTDLKPEENAHSFIPDIEVTGESTLEAAKRLASGSEEQEPFCLNYASAKNPGGGFLNGSQAQEESLARSSGLYRCQLTQQEMYDYHRSLGTTLYSDHILYSPGVPVIRNDEGLLLETPYTVAFLTSPAVNAGAVRHNEPRNIPQIEPVLRERMRKLLWVAWKQGHTRLILGAWGCGVFQNDPAMIARLFGEFLGEGGVFHPCFQRVVFAVYDRGEEQKALNAFRAQWKLL